MNWIFLALLAPFIYAINVFLDKYLIESKFPDYRALPVFSAILALPVFTVLFLLGVEFLSFKDAFWVILSGIFTILAFSLYLEALIKEETSIIIILMQSTPVLILILSYLFLGELINQKQSLGFMLLFLSSAFASLKKNQNSFKISKALIYILMADVLWALSYIVIKFVSGTITFPSLIMFESLGLVIGVSILLIFLPVIRKSFIKTIRKIKKPILGLVLLNESLFLIAKIITLLAITLGPVALISILGSIQIFYGILLGLLLTLILPKVFREDLSKKGLMKKAFLGFVAFIGIILVS